MGAAVICLADLVTAESGALHRFEAILRFVKGDDAASMTHADLEEKLAVEGRELMRLLLQTHLDERAARETRLERVVDADGLQRGHVEKGHDRPMCTIFGEVEVSRIAYRGQGRPNLYPADGTLNLPQEKHSHGVRRRAALAAAQGSYEAAVEAIERETGQGVGKRQVEELAVRAAYDFEDYYAAKSKEPTDLTDVLVLTCDGKGIVMIPKALRETTRKAAEQSRQKLATRLSKGEKGNRKRMAEVGCVYTVTPVPRTPEDILGEGDQDATPRASPRARAKWVTASVVDDAKTVVARVFDEAERRDPQHLRTWIALVDGNNHQLDLIEQESSQRKVELTIVVDLVHVLEYLWGAAWSFFDEGDPQAEEWVRERGLAILNGNSSNVAGGIRRSATRRGLDAARRKAADVCADYLIRKRPYLDYPTALARGWPLATGVIEGAVRHVVKDRMGITGARWGLQGAEAVLKLRAIRTNGDFDQYWAFHLIREKGRIHESRYWHNSIPT